MCIPFFSTRRRRSRLIAGTMRWRMRSARNLAKLQRPNGRPRVVALGRPGARWQRFAALTSAAGLRACAVGSAPTAVPRELAEIGSDGVAMDLEELGD